MHIKTKDFIEVARAYGPLAAIIHAVVLERGGDVTQAELAAFLGAKPAEVERLLDELVMAGLVRRAEA